MASHSVSNPPSGFTIIELLVVIVIIAILSAITVVAYSGVTQKAHLTAIKSDLSNGYTALSAYQAMNNTFPANMSTAGFTPTPGDTMTYNVSSANDAYCLQASGWGYTYTVTNNNNVPTAGSCQGTVASASTGTPTMQSFTQADCTGMTTYIGTNPSAIITLKDPRGSSQSYQVAKLADGNCWMLDNLKLGSTTGPITLTPQDSDVTSNFTLPQVGTTGSTSASGIGNGVDTPYVYGPVPGDTGSGATNYGYLYNFAAATAGATTENLPGNGTDNNTAPSSICPAGWTLPTGGTSDNTTQFGALDIAFGGGGTGNGDAAQWKYSGSFQGTFAGFWGGGFESQGASGYAWSRSASPGNTDSAFIAGFYSNAADPSGGISRYYGLGVRCLFH